MTDQAVADSWVLEVREPGRIPLLVVVDDRLPVGRAGNGLLLADERLSRRHCEFTVGADGALSVVDCGSSNGTRCNDEPVSRPTRVVTGDVVQIGDTSIHIGRRPIVEAIEAASSPLRSTRTGSIAGVDAAFDDELRASAVGGTITLAFSDIVDSTAQNRAMGDRNWVALLQRHDAIIRRHLTANDGTEVKGQGDGFLLTFASARRGVLFAVAVQRELAALRADDPTFDLHVRVGVHTGEVIRTGGDVFGRHVHYASRVASEGGPDEVVVSSLVHELVSPMGDFAFGAARLVTLKGFEGSTTLYPVAWEGPEPASLS